MGFNFSQPGTVAPSVNQIWDYVPVVGDPANSTAQKLRGMIDNQAVATTGGLTETFDNVLLSLTASQTDETIPATGESDSGELHVETAVATFDETQVSSDSGTTFTVTKEVSANSAVWATNAFFIINNIGNSTGRYRYVMSSDVGTRVLQQIITTVS